MSGWVLRRTDGAFVSPPGRASSYTRDLTRARIFGTEEQADRERCVENERAVRVEDCLGVS